MFRPGEIMQKNRCELCNNSGLILINGKYIECEKEHAFIIRRAKDKDRDWYDKQADEDFKKNFSEDYSGL